MEDIIAFANVIKATPMPPFQRDMVETGEDDAVHQNTGAIRRMTATQREELCDGSQRTLDINVPTALSKSENDATKCIHFDY
jgi:hypothetical protein